MKKNITLIGIVAMLVATSCSNSNNNNEPVETPTPTPPPPTEKKVVIVDSSQKEGTTIKINDQGVSIENKDGSKKNNVKISKDSSSIEITRPK